MNRRWVALTAAAVLVVPLAASCSSDDDDDAPADPTVTLFEGTSNPNVSTDVTG